MYFNIFIFTNLFHSVIRESMKLDDNNRIKKIHFFMFYIFNYRSKRPCVRTFMYAI